MELNIFIALSPCKELYFSHWTFWRNNSLILFPQTISTAEHLSLNLNSRIYFLDSDLSFYEIYKYELQDLKYTISKFGDVTSPDLLNKTKFIWERRSNLSTIHLNMNYFNNPPYTIKTRGSQKVSGFLGEIFYSLQGALMFQYTLNDPDSNGWGYIQSNGSYNGILGLIEMGTINMSISDTALTWKRSLTFDFSFPLLNQAKKIITRQPNEAFDTMVYFRAFSLQFWVVLFFSTILLVFLNYLALRFYSLDDKYQSTPLEAAFSFTILSLFCRENFMLNASWPGKILFLSVLLWGFLISVSYNAVLTSVLTASRISTPINSLEEMLHSSDYTLVFRTSGAVRDFFQNAPNDTIGKINMLIEMA